NAEADNYYLSQSSPGVDAGDPHTTVPSDRDGNLRPLGAGYDIGAYEYGLALRKLVDQSGSVPPGTLLRYTIAISNTSTNDVDNAVVSDTLHPYLEYVGPLEDNVGGGGDYDPDSHTVTWNGTLAARKITYIAFTVRVAERTAAGEIITNVATVNYTATNTVQNTVSAKAGPRYVAPTGDDDANSCLDPDSPCRTVQYAIAQALAGDEILLAEGTYTTTGGAVATITKSLTLRGGYGADWTYDPRVYASVLDGQGSADGVSITGPATVTLDSLHIAGGNRGIAAVGGNLVVAKTWVYSNTGDGLLLDGTAYRLDNAIIARNGGAGLHAIGGSAGRLRHDTFADNTGDGVTIADSGSTANFTNTIFSNHTTCVNGGSGTTVYLLYTLFDGCTTETTGAGTITVNHPVHGDPDFLDAAQGDYHIGASSAALDAGLDAGLTDDVDNDSRPKGVSYDLGADELLIDVEVSKQASAAVVNTLQPGTRLTYTLAATNTGYVSLQAVITDYLPAHVTPTQFITWEVNLDVGGHWQQTLPVTVETGYAGTLTNVVRVATVEGARDAYTITTLAQSPHLLLVKQADPTVAWAGQPLAYTILVTNTGNLTLHAVV
ncbi:MAG TPA: DUF11 domain-containing protein, partial [Anaerolineae bacterium]|nr:DUF11 domain-containing protein [Anaerolineae bacterium]